MVITESIPFLHLQKHEAVLPAQGNCKAWVRNYSLREDERTEALCSPLSITDCITPGREGKTLGLMGAELPCWWASVSVSAALTAHPSWWQILWIHSSVQQLPRSRQLRRQPCISASARGVSGHRAPSSTSGHTPAPRQWPGWGCQKGSWVFHSCELGFSSKSCVPWSSLAMPALLASAKWNGGASAKNTFLWECIQLPPTSVPKSALKMRQNLVLSMLIWSGAISRAILK